MSEEGSPLIHCDEFQDFDFDVFADNEESMPVSSEVRLIFTNYICSNPFLDACAVY